MAEKKTNREEKKSYEPYELWLGTFEVTGDGDFEWKEGEIVKGEDQPKKSESDRNKYKFKWKIIEKYDNFDDAYKGFKAYASKQLSYTDEELRKIWGSGRLDIELKKGGKLLNWTGVFVREVNEKVDPERGDGSDDGDEQAESKNDSGIRLGDALSWALMDASFDDDDIKEEDVIAAGSKELLESALRERLDGTEATVEFPYNKIAVKGFTSPMKKMYKDVTLVGTLSIPNVKHKKYGYFYVENEEYAPDEKNLRENRKEWVEEQVDKGINEIMESRKLRHLGGDKGKFKRLQPGTVNALRTKYHKEFNQNRYTGEPDEADLDATEIKNIIKSTIYELDGKSFEQDEQIYKVAAVNDVVFTRIGGVHRSESEDSADVKLFDDEPQEGSLEQFEVTVGIWVRRV